SVTAGNVLGISIARPPTHQAGQRAVARVTFAVTAGGVDVLDLLNAQRASEDFDFIDEAAEKLVNSTAATDGFGVARIVGDRSRSSQSRRVLDTVNVEPSGRAIPAH